MANLKKCITIDVEHGFLDTGCHYCVGNGVACHCKNMSDSYGLILCMYLPLLCHLLKVGDIALNKWESEVPILCLACFGILLCGIGPLAWLEAYPERWADTLVRRNNERGEVDSFKVETGKRLLSVTRFWNKKYSNWMLVTFVHYSTFEVDKLLRWLQNKDSDRTGHALIYHLSVECAKFNPVIVALVGLWDSLKPAGDMCRLVDTWRKQLGRDDSAEFSARWALQGFAYVGLMIGQLTYRFRFLMGRSAPCTYT